MNNQDVKIYLNEKTRNLTSNFSKINREESLILTNKIYKSKHTNSDNFSNLAFNQIFNNSQRKVNKIANYRIKNEPSAFDDLIFDHNQININSKLLKLDFFYKSQSNISNNMSTIPVEFNNCTDPKVHKENISTPVNLINLKCADNKNKKKFNNGAFIYNNSSRHNDIRNDITKLPNALKIFNSEATQNKNSNFQTSPLNMEIIYQVLKPNEKFKNIHNKNNSQVYKVNNLQISKIKKLKKKSKKDYTQQFLNSKLLNSKLTELSIKSSIEERKKNLTEEKFMKIDDYVIEKYYSGIQNSINSNTTSNIFIKNKFLLNNLDSNFLN